MFHFYYIVYNLIPDEQQYSLNETRCQSWHDVDKDNFFGKLMFSLKT